MELRVKLVWKVEEVDSVRCEVWRSERVGKGVEAWGRRKRVYIILVMVRGYGWHSMRYRDDIIGGMVTIAAWEGSRDKQVVWSSDYLLRRNRDRA